MEPPRTAHTWRGRVRDRETKATCKLGRRRSDGAEQELPVGLKTHRRDVKHQATTGIRMSKLCLEVNECLRGLDLGVRICGDHTSVWFPGTGCPGSIPTYGNSNSRPDLGLHLSFLVAVIKQPFTFQRAMDSGRVGA